MTAFAWALSPRRPARNKQGCAVIKITIMTATISAAAAGTAATALLWQETGGAVLSEDTLLPAGVVAGLFVLAVSMSWKASKFVERLVTRVDSLHDRLDEFEQREANDG